MFSGDVGQSDGKHVVISFLAEGSRASVPLQARQAMLAAALVHLAEAEISRSAATRRLQNKGSWLRLSQETSGDLLSRVLRGSMAYAEPYGSG
jgi:hypothetical protein